MSTWRHCTYASRISLLIISTVCTIVSRLLFKCINYDQEQLQTGDAAKDLPSNLLSAYTGAGFGRLLRSLAKHFDTFNQLLLAP
jgi:H+/Cl- antiporter ClcA